MMPDRLSQLQITDRLVGVVITYLASGEYGIMRERVIGGGG
jgi:hypothetical protein